MTPLKPLPDNLKPYETEMRAFYRHLPRLLADGEEGRHVVIRGDQVYDAWDTFWDARQYGYEKFGDGRFLAQEVDARLLDGLAVHFGPLPAVEPQQLTQEVA